MINDRKREVERKIGNLCNFVTVIGDKKKSETKVELTTCTEQRQDKGRTRTKAELTTYAEGFSSDTDILAGFH